MRTRTTVATALAALFVLAGCSGPGGNRAATAPPVAAATPVPGGSGYEGPRPQDQNLLAWTGDPGDAGHVTAQSAAGVGGRVTLVRIVLREEITWSNIWLGLAGVDPGAQLSNCYLGVYDAQGTLRSSTADISPQLTSDAIAKALPLAKPFTAPPAPTSSPSCSTASGPPTASPSRPRAPASR